MIAQHIIETRKELVHRRNLLDQMIANFDQLFPVEQLPAAPGAKRTKRPPGAKRTDAGPLEPLPFLLPREERAAKVCLADIHRELAGEEKTETAPASPAVAEPETDRAGGKRLQPREPAGIKLGLGLKQPFGAPELKAALQDDDRNRANYWLAAWFQKDWIAKAGFGIYNRTLKFGR